MSDTQGADPLAMAERAPKLAQQLQGLRGIVCVTNHGERDDYYPSDKPNPCAIEAAQALTALARAYVEQTEALHKAEIARDHQHSLYISECGETDRIAEILGTDADLELPEGVAALKARAEAAEAKCLRLEKQFAQESEWSAAFEAALQEHWLTGVECDHETKTDTASCYCSAWRSLPQRNIPAAVKEWIEHVKQAAVVHCAAHKRAEEDGG